MQVYRVQPKGLELGSHRSETSCGDLDRGVHVCYSLEELQGAVNGWCEQDYTPEIVVIECDRKDVRENGDYEGSVLVGNAGKIVARKPFDCWASLAEACRDYAVNL
jgi:hypothetical protein